MITTIQLDKKVKEILDSFKESRKDTYEEVIVRMITKIESEKSKRRGLLIEGAKAMAEDSLRITNEWESTDSEINKYSKW